MKITRQEAAFLLNSLIVYYSEGIGDEREMIRGLAKKLDSEHPGLIEEECPLGPRWDWDEE